MQEDSLSWDEESTMDARYLNVDLVLHSDSDLSALAEYLEGKVFFLSKEFKEDGSSILLESNLGITSGPEEDLQELVNVIESMPDSLMCLWFDCSKKVMDIGFECGSMEGSLDSFIGMKLVQSLARLECAINIRIYPSAEKPGEEGTINGCVSSEQAV